ncbi:MAG: N-acetylneuraminate synthase family protein, partial [bacterium]|nr:N-acetylneuraminate synthase family protein [bacterium]
MNEKNKVTLIAEAAQGYEGDKTLAKMLVRAAKEGGADLVKFQIVQADELATPLYQYYNLFKSLEMPFEAWSDVAHEAQERKIGIMFDVFGQDSLRIAHELKAAAVKIHATDFFNDELVSAALEKAPQVYFSAGGIEIEEIASFLNRWGEKGKQKPTLLCGFQAEPTELKDTHLARLASIREKFPQLKIGFMDHADGDTDEASWLGILALPYGISAIEKHITLDRSLKLEDFISALAPLNFTKYVERIRKAELALGNSSLRLSEAEQTYRTKAVKVVVSRRTIHSGSRINPDDIILLRSPPQEGQKRIEEIKKAIGKKT